jgi:glycosyltransferase involved in cell wall biosynthesis
MKIRTANKMNTNRQSARKKILMITPYLPYPPYSGGQTRSYNLIKHLAKTCQITLICFSLPDQNDSSLEPLKKYCQKIYTIKRGKTWSFQKIFRTGFSPYPFLVSNYHSERLNELVISETSRCKYDLIHVECFYLMPNIPKVKIPIVLIDQTIEYAVYQHFVDTLTGKMTLLKPFLWLDVAKLKYWEVYFWKKADRLVAVSKDDKKLMEKLSKRTADLSFNGVADDLFKERKIIKEKKPTILFGVANFKWMQNTEGVSNLLRFVWPEVKKRVPKAVLHIAGRHSKEFLAKNKKLISYPESIRVGDVKSPAETYLKSWILVAPVKSGGGSRTKFFEAMACGLPILTTPQGIEGIEATSGKNVVIAKNYQELIEKTINMLSDQKARTKIGQEGKRLVANKYSWKVSADQLLDVYKKALR